MHTLHVLTTSLSNQMVLDHENMKASVPDVCALVHEGGGEDRRVEKVDLPVSETLIKFISVPLFSTVHQQQLEYYY